MNGTQQHKIEVNSKGIDRLLRHIRHVQESTTLIGEYLIAHNDLELGKQVIANGFIHDQSKFYGIEFEYLVLEEEGLPEIIESAISQHNTTNFHHPEAWGGIKLMPEVFLIEMIADWHARSSEFGTDLRVWIKDNATKRFHFKRYDKVYRSINKYLNILLDKQF